MQLIKIIAGLVFSALSVNAAYAEIPLGSKTDLEGNWKLLQTRANGDAKKAMDRQDTWIFKNGQVTILHIPREGTFYDQAPVDYTVEEGKLKIAILGRPDKFETFSLESKEGNKMTLIGKFNNFYDFIKN